MRSRSPPRGGEGLRMVSVRLWTFSSGLIYIYLSKQECLISEQSCQDGETWKILTKRPFYPSIIQKFCARKLLVENFWILRWFVKWLSFSLLGCIWRKMGIAGLKKSTPIKNLALPFYFFACLQNRERAPNRGQKRAHNHSVCAEISLFALGFPSGEGWTMLPNGSFSLQIASKSWTNFVLKNLDIHSSI